MCPNKGRLLRGGEVGAMGGGGGEWQCQQGVMVRARKGAAEEGAAFGQNVLQPNASIRKIHGFYSVGGTLQ